MANKKIMLIYETAGGGHLANARAIQAALAERHPELSVFMMHVATEVQSQRVKALYESYNVMLKSDPRMVKMGFRVLNSINAEALIMPLIPKAMHNLEACIRRERPDLIVSVFSMINHATLRVLKNIGWHHKVPYLIFCTDLSNGFLKHWVDNDADCFVALSDVAAEQLIAFGAAPQKIKVLHGLPVNPAFAKNRRGTQAARQELRLAPDRFTVLITMGGVAVKNTWRFARDLAGSGLPLQVMVVCGRNRLLERRVRRIASRSTVPMRVYGYTDQMPLLMEAADCIISKPGPGTIAEAIEMQRPMLIDAIREPMPQEKGNLD
ncbi:MAG: hypothetical protein KGR26_06465, partial [Cyanobacteria bacterium REEB65]|nr:hypothetical protein [Cyanobacteria bacterium REEB65]